MLTVYFCIVFSTTLLMLTPDNWEARRALGRSRALYCRPCAAPSARLS
jgi:hypothetical protein